MNNKNDNFKLKNITKKRYLHQTNSGGPLLEFHFYVCIEIRIFFELQGECYIFLHCSFKNVFAK